MPDFLLFASALLLLSLGLVMVYSASSVMAMAETGDPLHYVKRQLVGVIVGTVAMLFLMQIDYRIYQRLANVGVALAYLLLVVVLIQGAEIGGSRRWLNLGLVNLQPSELSKLALVNFIAAYAASRPHDMKRFWRGLVPPLMVTAVFFALIMLEPDFGTAASITGTALIMLFACGARVLHLFGVGAAAVPLLGVMVWREPYRMERILSFRDPGLTDEYGWNIIQSLLAIGTGGLFGWSLGSSRRSSLPAEQHTDFIFAI